jgi:hypothetical protein
MHYLALEAKKGTNCRVAVQIRKTLVLNLYMEARIRIRIKVKGRIRIRIKVTSRIRIRIKIMRIRNTVIKEIGFRIEWNIIILDHIEVKKKNYTDFFLSKSK